MVRPLPLSPAQRTFLAGWSRLLKTALNAAIIGAVLAVYMTREETETRRVEARAGAIAARESAVQDAERAFYEALGQPGNAQTVACGRIAQASLAITGEISDRAMQLCSGALGGQIWRAQ